MSIAPVFVPFILFFPQVIARTPTDFDSGNAQNIIPLGSPVAGELLLVMYGTAGSPTISIGAGSDWSPIEQVSQSNNITAAWTYKIAAGGDSLRLDHASSPIASAIAYRIKHADSVDGTSYTGTGTNWNAPSHSPTGGVKKYLWIPFYAVNAGLTAPPANYSSGSSQATGNAPFLYSVERLLEASSENPGAATANSANQAGYTLAVHPPA